MITKLATSWRGGHEMVLHYMGEGGSELTSPVWYPTVQGIIIWNRSVYKSVTAWSPLYDTPLYKMGSMYATPMYGAPLYMGVTVCNLYGAPLYGNWEPPYGAPLYGSWVTVRSRLKVAYCMDGGTRNVTVWSPLYDTPLYKVGVLYAPPLYGAPLYSGVIVRSRLMVAHCTDGGHCMEFSVDLYGHD